MSLLYTESGIQQAEDPIVLGGGNTCDDNSLKGLYRGLYRFLLLGLLSKVDTRSLDNSSSGSCWHFLLLLIIIIAGKRGSEI